MHVRYLVACNLKLCASVNSRKLASKLTVQSLFPSLSDQNSAMNEKKHMPVLSEACAPGWGNRSQPFAPILESVSHADRLERLATAGPHRVRQDIPYARICYWYSSICY
jgi:hypothetical protein